MRLRTLLRIARLTVVPALIALAAPAVVSPLAALTPAAAAQPGGGQWDPTLPQIISAGAQGDPVAIANASLQASTLAAQTTLDLGRKFLGSLGIFGDPAPGAAPGRVYGKEAVEYVIQRAGAQMGVPYSWGGGSLTGPSEGFGSGAGTVGFDCSGLTRYAFAGVGVQIPRFSGDQYNAGRKVPPSQAKRGDLLFWGPGGGQHVAIYLGGGRMLEASGSAGKVTVSPVRTSGMTPYVTRIIEY